MQNDTVAASDFLLKILAVPHLYAAMTGCPIYLDVNNHNHTMSSVRTEFPGHSLSNDLLKSTNRLRVCFHQLYAKTEIETDDMRARKNLPLTPEVM